MFEGRRTFLPSLIAAFAWGAMFPIAADALKRIDPFSLTAIRYGVATLVFLTLLRLIEGNVHAHGRHRELAVLGAIGFAGFNLLTYVGLEHTHPQNAALIVALQPLITALGLWLTTRQIPTRHTFVAMGLALLGVFLVITKGHPASIASGDGALGELLVLIGCACWIGYTLAATAVAVAIGQADVPGAADLGAVWWQTLYIFAIGAVVAVLAWNEGVRRIGPANAALFLNLVPIISFAIAISIQGYDPNGWELAGAALTIAALVYANLRGRARAPRAHPHPGGVPARAGRSA
jgi:drug/metabolite transporter (DMT)-like permease